MMTTAPTAAIRVAGIHDLDAVVHLHTEQGSRPAGPASQQERQTWHRMLRTPDLTVYLAVLNGEVVGTATAMEMPNVTYDCAPTLFVEAVVVSATHRRRGIATA